MTMREPARTAIGVDLGEYNLYTASPATADRTDVRRISGNQLCTELDELRDRTVVLLASGEDRDAVAASVEERYAALVAKIDAGAREICTYAGEFDDPVLVTETSHLRADLWAWLTDPDAHRGTAWLLPTAHRRLLTIAPEYRLEVRTVPREYSTRECHACGVIGDRYRNDRIRCVNSACRVTTVDADFNAATVLAKRYYPGHSCDYHPVELPRSRRKSALAADGGEPHD